MPVSFVRCTEVALCATAVLFASACGSDMEPLGSEACAPASLIATQPHSIDSGSPLIDGSLSSQLGLSRSVVAGTVTDAAVDDPEDSGLRDGRLTLDPAEVVWRNPASSAEPPTSVTADYLAVSDDSGEEICVGDRVWVLLTQPEDDSASPPVYLAQAVFPITDGKILAKHEVSLPQRIRGIDVDDLGAALSDVDDTIPPELSAVVDLPMEERLIRLGRASG